MLTPQTIGQIERQLGTLLETTSAYAAVLFDRDGKIVAACGDTAREDLQTLAKMLASNFGLLRRFSKLDPGSLFQPGPEADLLNAFVDDHWLVSLLLPKNSSRERASQPTQQAVAALRPLLAGGTS